jgi:hypothetical protein
MCQDARFTEGHVRLILAQASEIARSAFCCGEPCCNAVCLEILSVDGLSTRAQKGTYSAWCQLGQLDQKIVHFSGIWLNKLRRDRQAREGQGCKCQQTHVEVWLDHCNE